MKRLSEAEQLECFIRQAFDFIQPQRPFGGTETSWIENLEALKIDNDLPELRRKAHYLIRWAFQIQSLNIAVLIDNCLEKNCDLIEYYFNSNSDFIEVIKHKRIGNENQHWLALFYIHRVPERRRNLEYFQIIDDILEKRSRTTKRRNRESNVKSGRQIKIKENHIVLQEVIAFILSRELKETRFQFEKFFQVYEKILEQNDLKGLLSFYNELPHLFLMLTPLEMEELEKFIVTNWSVNSKELMNKLKENLKQPKP